MFFMVPIDPSEGSSDAEDLDDLLKDLGDLDDKDSEGSSEGSDSSDEVSEAMKVELDLDDAPFLQEEEEEEEEKEEKQETKKEEKKTESDEGEEEKGSFFARKKKLIIIALGVLLLIGLGLGVFLFFFTGDEEEEVESPSKPRVVVIPSEEPSTNGTLPFSSVVDLDPFIVPQEGSEGEVRFLRCSLSLPIDDPAQEQEINGRKLEVRDAVYYYLANRPLTFLRTEDEYQSLKEDLIRVLNEHISVKKINDVYIQEYVVTGR